MSSVIASTLKVQNLVPSSFSKAGALKVKMSPTRLFQRWAWNRLMIKPLGVALRIPLRRRDRPIHAACAQVAEGDIDIVLFLLIPAPDLSHGNDLGDSGKPRDLSLHGKRQGI